MKKSLLFSAALAASITAFAAAPTLQKAQVTDFSVGERVSVSKSSHMITRAEENLKTMDFTYAGTPVDGYSLNGATGGVTRIYLGFEMSASDLKAFKGSKVTGFNVYSPFGNNNAANTIGEARFFYSFSLMEEDYSQDFTMTSSPMAENRIALTEPYTITGEENGIIFGYSFVIPKANNMFYLISDGVKTNGMAGIYGASNDTAFPQEFYTCADQIGALCMSLTLEAESFPTFGKFASIPSTICLPLGQATSLPVTLSATSDSPIESISVEYTLGGKLNEYEYSASTPIPAGASRMFKVNLEFPAQSEKLKETVEFKIIKVNGQPNEDEGAVAEATVIVVDEVPVRQTLFEEYTCTRCTWCPRGFAALEYIAKNYPDFVTASYHNTGQGADPMAVVSNFPSSVKGNPGAFLNRTDEQMDPFYGNQEYMDLTVPMVGNILALNEIPTVWKISASHEWESSDILVAKADVANMAGYENEDYTIAYLLVADGLSGSTSLWNQTNGYASYAPDPANPEELNAFCRGGEYGKSSVKGLVFNDVVISGDGIHGVKGSLPTSLEAQVQATHTLRFDLSKIKSSLNVDRNKLRVITAVLDKNGQVLNCAKDEVNDYDQATTGVADMVEENAPVEYFNLNGMKVANPTEGIFIRRQGSKTEKVVVK